MSKLDKIAQDALKMLYTQFKSTDEITVSSPEYEKTTIDYLVKSGLLEKHLDVSTFSGWAYFVRATHEGELVYREILELPSSKIEEFISQGEIIMKEEYHHGIRDKSAAPDYISGPKSDQWFSEIRVFNARILANHPLHDQIENVCKNHRRQQSPHENMMGYLRALIGDDEFWKETEETKGGGTQMNNKVFIVHGHDNEAKLETARTLSYGGFEPIILHEQPDSGRTIIEKIERFADVCYAIVLYTECDLGRDKNVPVEKERFRARQNVVFEHGYLISRLGRDHVTALVKGNVETPGDISGVVYTEMDKAGAWKMQLAKNMQDVGLDIDMNTFLK